jgi:aspartyl-tRNA(Asn)/glutamyl-tRNA(Gln) amidotransferase subunit C
MSKKLDAATVKKIAQLAKLSNDPSPEFLEKYGEELGAILEYVDQLQEVDTSGISPTDGIRTISISQLREDHPPEDNEEYIRIRNNIIANFPTKTGVLLELPGIFSGD